ncbi:hypothetical protein [Streptomyces sp.]|nr:hypothetical protein [Streptomyces sp.]HET6356514.1 hypothetical protein [Streptomyces sp.]
MVSTDAELFYLKERFVPAGVFGIGGAAMRLRLLGRFNVSAVGRDA